MIKYPWLNKSYKLIKNVFNKEYTNNVHLLLTAKYGSEENNLLWFLIRNLFCTLKKDIYICNKCTNCNLINEYKNHPDLYYIKINNNDSFNTEVFNNIIKFTKHLPIFNDKKLILILYEKSHIDDNTIKLIISLFKHINNYYSYNKIILKVNIYLKKEILSYLLTYCIHIHILPPSEDMCILWLKDNEKILIDRFNNEELLTALRVNKIILKDTIFFLKINWNIYKTFTNAFIKSIHKNKYSDIFQYILSDINNCKLYLYWLIELLLDIIKISFKISLKCITNIKYYSIINDIYIKEFNSIDNKLIYILLKEVISCYTTINKYPYINIENILLELMLKWLNIINI